jgi:hypothetical protein
MRSEATWLLDVPCIHKSTKLQRAIAPTILASSTSNQSTYTTARPFLTSSLPLSICSGRGFTRGTRDSEYGDKCARYGFLDALILMPVCNQHPFSLVETTSNGKRLCLLDGCFWLSSIRAWFCLSSLSSLVRLHIYE